MRRYHRVSRPLGLSNLLLLSALVALLFGVTLLAPGCATNPATGKKQIILVSEGQELQMGKEGDAAVSQEYGTYNDQQLASEADRVGQKLASVSERADLAWHFRVLDSPVVNAFALPGGYIYITRGIMAVLNSEAQLAGVLGHEIGHVTARHSAQQMTQQTLFGLGLGIGTILVPGIRPYGQLAQQGLQLLFLKYSRSDETQADELGIRYATRAGYDPREIPKTYETLQKLEEKSGQSLPSFLSTHPDPGQRVARTTEEANAAVAGKNTSTMIVAADTYKESLDNVVYGDDPRQGYVENGVFYHPDLRFQVRFPSGWKVSNTQSAVTGVAPDQSAGVELTIVDAAGSSDPTAYVNALLSAGKITNASGRSTRVRDWPAWVGQITVSDGQGGTSTLFAAWVERQAGRYYQFVGAPGNAAGQSGFNETLASFDVLTDATKLNRLPNRVKIVRVTQPSATLATVVGAQSNMAVPVDEVAFINNVALDAILRQGFVLKVVRKP